MESQGSSLDFSDTEEPSFLHYDDTPRDPEEQATQDVAELQTDEESEVPEEDEVETPVQRATTIERVISDAIVHHASVEELKVILDAGSKILNFAATRPNPLHYAVWQRYPEAAELVLEYGKY